MENPTPETGDVSTLSRIERFLSNESPPKAQEKEPEPAQEAQQEEAPAVELPESDAQDESSEPQISLSDLAAYLGVDESTLDVSEDGSVAIKTKIDGKEGAAKFQDLVKSYQLQGHIDNKARAAAEAEKTVRERMQQFETQSQAQINHLNQLAQVAHQELMADLGNIDWNTLARTDPAEYVIKRQEAEARQGRVNQLLQAADQQRNYLTQAQQMRAQQEFQTQAQRLVELVPEWKDAKVADAEKASVANWLTQKGASPQTISSLNDAVVVAAIRAAMLAEKGGDKQAITEKKVRSAPKLARPGQAIDPSQAKSDSVRALKENIRKSGGKSGVADYLLATGKV